MEHHTGNNDGDRRRAGGAFGHKAQIGQQETKLETKNTCDVTVKFVSDMNMVFRKETYAYNGAPMYCTCAVSVIFLW